MGKELEVGGWRLGVGYSLGLQIRRATNPARYWYPESWGVFCYTGNTRTNSNRREPTEKVVPGASGLG